MLMIFVRTAFFLQTVIICSGLGKRYNLTQLVMYPIEGMPPPNFGAACRAAHQIVFDTANQRSDILSDYYIQPQYYDEFLGLKAVSLATNFYENDAATLLAIKSPMVIGPFFSQGCKTMGSVLHQLYAAAISTACGSRVLANRKLFPNLYTILNVADLSPKVVVNFVEKIGKWKRMAIISYAGNLLDYTAAIATQRIASEHGIEVPIFNIILEPDLDAVAAIRANDLRVIFFLVSINSLLLRLLCLAYQIGLTGPKYVFLTNIVLYVEPDDLPDSILPGCPKERFLELYRNVFWIGPAMKPIARHVQSDLGFNSKEFDQVLAKRLGNLPAADYEYRFLCADAAMLAVFALDSADKDLRKDLNLSLADYSKQPHIVVSYVNRSMAKTDRNALRVGRIRFSLSDRQLSDISMIEHWTPEYGLKELFAFIPSSNESTLNNSSYFLQPLIVDGFKWPSWTKSLIPPKDSALFRQKLDSVSMEIFIIIAAISGIAASCQLVAIFLTWRKKRVVFPMTKTFGYLGCLILDAAAILFAFAIDQMPQLRIVLVALGLAAVNGVVSFRWIVLLKGMQREIPALFITPQITPVGRPSSPNSPSGVHLTMTARCYAIFKLAISESQQVFDTVVLIASLSFAGLFGILVAACLGGSQMTCSSKPLPVSGVIYYEKRDEFVQILVTQCGDDSQTGWIALFIVIHLIVLLGGLFCSYQFKAKTASFRTMVSREVKEMGLATIGVINALSLLVAATLAVVILSFKGLPSRQYIAISFACLFTSATTSSTWMCSLLARIYRKGNRRSSTILPQ